MLSGYSCSVQDAETRVRDVEEQLSLELHQGQETEPGGTQQRKITEPVATSGFKWTSTACKEHLVSNPEVLNSRISSSWSILLLIHISNGLQSEGSPAMLLSMILTSV